LSHFLNRQWIRPNERYHFFLFNYLCHFITFSSLTNWELIKNAPFYFLQVPQTQVHSSSFYYFIPFLIYIYLTPFPLFFTHYNTYINDIRFFILISKLYALIRSFFNFSVLVIAFDICIFPWNYFIIV